MVSLKPEDISNIGRQLWSARIIIAAVEIGLFELIGKKGATLEDVMDRGRLSERGAKAILNALIPLGLLQRNDNGICKLTQLSALHLMPGKGDYLGFQLLHMARLWEAWGDLPESVRSGIPHWVRHPGQRGIEDLVVLAEMLYPRNFSVSSRIAKLLGAGKKWKGLRILDVAAGSGAWSLAFLAADPTAKATAVDFGPVLGMAKRKAQELNVADRFEILPGNIREVDFGEGKYDLVILGHICHSEGPEHSEKLISKSAKSLAHGGKLLIADMVPEDDRRGPLHPLLFAVNMLVNTTEGGTFTFSEYRAWCESAGLKNVRNLAIKQTDHSPLIIADKA